MNTPTIPLPEPWDLKREKAPPKWVAKRYPQLRPELQRFLKRGPKGADFDIVRHPYLVGVIRSMCQEIVEGMNQGIVNATREAERARSSGDLEGLMSVLKRGFRVQYLLDHSPVYADSDFLSREQLRQGLLGFWDDAESPHTLGTRHLVGMFRYAGYFSDGDLPGETLRIYRGCNRGHQRGVSWSEAYETAKFFTTYRKSVSGVVYAATIPQEGVLARIYGRGESEVVVDPVMLRNIRIETDAPEASEETRAGKGTPSFQS